MLYKQFIRHALETQPNLLIFQQSVDDILLKNNKVAGVKTKMGLEFHAKTVVLTAGTFLAGKIHVGLSNYEGGRAGDPAATSLAAKLRDLNLKVGRLKTGTPPRVDSRSVDFSVMEMQNGDNPTPVFSFLGDASEHPRQIPCYITHTNDLTHDLIRKGLDRSAMYSGNIEGVGPRYCPSIEDKVMRFQDKNSHQIFVEPEGLNSFEIYPNGISTSLPFDVQIEFVRSMQGFENAHIIRPGYAIEYDYYDPRGLTPHLETKAIEGLFFAGQINGTTGYEEAAAQGLIAGANAALKAKEKPHFTLKRNEAYIGVLIDDLITKGTQEPYRMFTSRAEYRLLLREDNADLRLTAKGYEIGLVDKTRWQKFNEKSQAIEIEKQRINSTWARPNTKLFEKIEKLINQPLTREYRFDELLRRPNLSYQDLMSIEEAGPLAKDPKVQEQVDIQIKYQGYIARQEEEIKRQSRNEESKIPANIDYTKVIGLSAEVTQKLQSVKPATIGMASRIPGITPAAISLLLVHLKKTNL